MKKTYINPSMEIVELKMQGAVLLPVSGQEVENGLAPEFGIPASVFDD